MSLHPTEHETGPHVPAYDSLLPQSPHVIPREGGGGTFTHRVCSLLSTFCLHSQNYPRIRTLLWEDSNPRPKRGQARAQDVAPSVPGRCPPSTGVSERHLRKSAWDRGRLLSCSWGRQELGKTFFRGCLKWSSRGRAPGVCRVAERGPGPGSAAEPGGASAPGTT